MKSAKRFKIQKKSKWQGKKSEEKEQKKCFQEEIVDAPFECNINIVAEKHLIRNYTCWCWCQCNEWSSIINLFSNCGTDWSCIEVVLSEVSKLFDSVISMRQGYQRNHSFLEKKQLHKIKNGFTFNKHLEISYQLMDRVMN